MRTGKWSGWRTGGLAALLGAGMPAVAGAQAPATPLQSIVVEPKARCVVAPDSAAGGLGLAWAIARERLATVVQTERGRTVLMTLDLFDRTYDASGRRLVSEEHHERSGVSARPAATVPPETLRSNGYARRDPDGVTYFAPDATVLLSPEFGGSYCLRLRAAEPKDSVPDGLGVAFTAPDGDRNHTDIEGVLWLDRTSGDLVRLDYRYVRMPAGSSTPLAGGRLRFRTLPGGLVITQHWAMRLPVVSVIQRSVGGVDRYLERRSDSAATVQSSLAITGLREFGGTVTRAEVKGQAPWVP